MKQKSLLETQTVSGKNRKSLSKIWGVICQVGFSFFQFSFLAIVLVAISLLFLSFYQYLLRSPYFKLEQVVVIGVEGELKSELLEMLMQNSDLNLLAMDLVALKPRLEKHPWIRSIQLEKQFPHDMVIRVEKERPWALVASETLSYINRWGEVFKEVDVTEPVDYPLITGISKDGTEQAGQLKQAIHVLRTFQSGMGPWSTENLSEIHIDRGGNLLFHSVSLPAVIKLRWDELDTRKDELRKIVDHLNKTGRIHFVRWIDLNFRDGAVVSFRKG